MENNASAAGVTHGGLFNTAEIKILICYILNAVNEPVPANMLVNVLHYEGIANAFEVSDAIISLTQSGHIAQHDNVEDTYVITNSGKEVSETLKTSLSYTVKDRACAATVKMLSKFKNAKDTEITTVRENGNLYIVCSLIENGRPFMSIKLLITDDAQASSIKERFLENPAEVYKTLIDMITK
ncbi:MAG: DUF4364 family protein [Clostridia bacterium]|nr:DUF4364 family protein [Clostridia bacterium]